MPALQLPSEMRLSSLQGGQSQIVVVPGAIPRDHGPVEMGGLGGMYLVKGILGCDALVGIASEPIEELSPGAGRRGIVVERLAHGVAAGGGQRVFLDGEHAHLDVTAAI